MLPASLQAHRSPSRAGWLACVVFVFCLFTLGCGDKIPPLAPVKGKVTTADGKALTSGQVSLVAEAPDPNFKPGASNGKIDDEGNYEIFTSGKSGAPLGKYKITVTPDMSKPGEKAGAIDMKYRDSSKTPLNFEVIENAEAGRYDLKLK